MLDKKIQVIESFFLKVEEIGRPKIIVMGNVMSHKMFRQVIEGEDLPVDFHFVGGNFDNAIKVAKEYKGIADTFITGSSILPILRHRIRVPVVGVRIEGLDIITAISKAYEYDSQNEVVLLVYGGQLHALNQLSNFCKIKIRQINYNSLNDIKKCVKELADKGIKIILGPTLPCLIAEEFGLKAIPIYSQQTFRETIEEAIHLAFINRYQKDLAGRLKAITDFASTGIISTDLTAHIIDVNAGACNILGISKDKLINKKIKDILPKLNLSIPSSNTDLVRQRQIIMMFKRELVVTVQPISYDSVITGFVLTIQEADDISKTERQIRYKKAKGRFMARWALNDVIGDSSIMRKTVEKAYTCAKTDFTVLITGETGVGKELFAHGIHNASKRSDKPFVSLNCAALPETLLESELFGYEEGTFTGSKKGGKTGLLELAHNGTLFLDEIGDLSLSAQAKLLRVLQEKEIIKLGGKEIIPIDIRLITATNKDLVDAVNTGRFRSDLYYRIDVLKLEIPQLLYRIDDIPALFEHFLKDSDPVVRTKLSAISGDIVPMLQSLKWPGNVRQLKSFVKKLEVLAMSQPLSLEVLNNLLRDVRGIAVKNTELESSFQQKTFPIFKPKEVSKEVIQNVIKQMKGNKTKAAEYLGISRTTIWRKLKDEKK